MKTVCLLGSPRRGGNSDALATRFLGRARMLGASIECFTRSELNYKGCINLFKCKNELTYCGQTDDLTPVLESISTAEVLVIASPVYFTGLSGQTKLVIDRMFSFFVANYPTATIKSRLGSGRQLVLLQSQGEPEDRYTDVLDLLSPGFHSLGYDKLHHVRAWGVREQDAVSENTYFLHTCDQTADVVYG